MARTAVVGVMGGHIATPETEKLAEEVGARIAKEGWFMLNGARNQGVMAASARGCHKAGGFSIGIHPDTRKTDDVAPGLDVVVFTGVGFARNVINVFTSDVLICLAGGPGTLNEAAYGRVYGTPTVLLGFDDRDLLGDGVHRVKDVDEAIALVKRLLEDLKRPES